MKTPFVNSTKQPLTRTKARNAAFMNQLATPGLGSLLAGRWIAGVGQLLLFLAGFGMFLCWVVLQMLQLYQEVVNGVEPHSIAWLGWAGALTSAAAWLWALFTTMSILREGRANEDKGKAAKP